MTLPTVPRNNRLDVLESILANVLDTATIKLVDIVNFTGLTDAQLRAIPVPVAASARVCLLTERVTVTSTAAALQSLMTGASFPVGTVVVELQADGGTVRIRRDNANPTTTLGYRLDDGMVLTVDSAPASVRVIAAVSTPMNVACFDRV